MAHRPNQYHPLKMSQAFAATHIKREGLGKVAVMCQAELILPIPDFGQVTGLKTVIVAQREDGSRFACSPESFREAYEVLIRQDQERSQDQQSLPFPSPHPTLNPPTT